MRSRRSESRGGRARQSLRSESRGGGSGSTSLAVYCGVACVLCAALGLLVVNMPWFTQPRTAVHPLIIHDFTPPSCAERSRSGDEISVTFTGRIDVNSAAGSPGAVFDATSKHDGPFSFVLGEGHVLPGWELGLLKMCVGEKRTLVLPPSIGYGALGSRDGAVPGGATLRFSLELVHIWRAGSADPILAAAAKSVPLLRSGAVKSLPPPPQALPPVAPPVAAAAVAVDEVALAAQVAELAAATRLMKGRGVVMETDSGALALTGKLQAATRMLLRVRYAPYITPGADTILVELALRFPTTMPDAAAHPGAQTIVIETAPIELMPHAVFTFLEIIRTWTGGAFHRNAGHVLQATILNGRHDGLAFQEYSPKFPHVENSLGFAGRPGGPPFYMCVACLPRTSLASATFSFDY